MKQTNYFSIVRATLLALLALLLVPKQAMAQNETYDFAFLANHGFSINYDPAGSYAGITNGQIYRSIAGGNVTLTNENGKWKYGDAYVSNDRFETRFASRTGMAKGWWLRENGNSGRGLFLSNKTSTDLLAIRNLWNGDAIKIYTTGNGLKVLRDHTLRWDNNGRPGDFIDANTTIPSDPINGKMVWVVKRDGDGFDNDVIFDGNEETYIAKIEIYHGGQTANITSSESSVTLSLGETHQTQWNNSSWKATPVFTSSNPTVASVDPYTGLVTASSGNPGVATITAYVAIGPDGANWATYSEFSYTVNVVTSTTSTGTYDFQVHNASWRGYARPAGGWVDPITVGEMSYSVALLYFVNKTYDYHEDAGNGLDSSNSGSAYFNHPTNRFGVTDEGWYLANHVVSNGFANGLYYKKNVDGGANNSPSVSPFTIYDLKNGDIVKIYYGKKPATAAPTIGTNNTNLHIGESFESGQAINIKDNLFLVVNVSDGTWIERIEITHESGAPTLRFSQQTATADLINLKFEEPGLIMSPAGAKVYYSSSNDKVVKIGDINTGDLMFVNVGVATITAKATFWDDTKNKEVTLTATYEVTAKADDAIWKVDGNTLFFPSTNKAGKKNNNNTGKLMPREVTAVPNITMDFGNAENTNLTLLRLFGGNRSSLIMDENGWEHTLCEADNNHTLVPTQGTFYKFAPGVDGTLTIRGMRKHDVNNPNSVILVDATATSGERLTFYPNGNSKGNATYAMTNGEVRKSGDIVELKNNNGETLASLMFGEIGGEDFKAAQSGTDLGNGFSYYTPGNGVNGEKDYSTFYTIVPKYSGELEVAVIVNAGRPLYIEENGIPMAGYNGKTYDSKFYGIIKIQVEANHNYEFYCSGSKLGFYGCKFSTDFEYQSYPIVKTLTFNGNTAVEEGVNLTAGHVYYLYANTAKTSSNSDWQVFYLTGFTFDNNFNFAQKGLVMVDNLDNVKKDGLFTYTQKAATHTIQRVTYTGTGSNNVTYTLTYKDNENHETTQTVTPGQSVDVSKPGAYVVKAEIVGGDGHRYHTYYVLTVPYSVPDPADASADQEIVEWIFDRIGYDYDAHNIGTQSIEEQNDLYANADNHDAQWSVYYKVRLYTDDGISNLYYLNVPVICNNVNIAGDNARYIDRTSGLLFAAKPQEWGTTGKAPDLTKILYDENNPEHQGKKRYRLENAEEKIYVADDAGAYITDPDPEGLDLQLRKMMNLQPNQMVGNIDYVTMYNGSSMTIPNLKAGQFIRVKWSRYSPNNGDNMIVENVTDLEGKDMDGVSIPLGAAPSVDQNGGYAYQEFKVKADGDVTFTLNQEGWNNFYQIAISNKFMKTKMRWTKELTTDPGDEIYVGKQGSINASTTYDTHWGAVYTQSTNEVSYSIKQDSRTGTLNANNSKIGTRTTYTWTNSQGNQQTRYMYPLEISSGHGRLILEEIGRTNTYLLDSANYVVKVYEYESSTQNYPFTWNLENIGTETGNHTAADISADLTMTDDETNHKYSYWEQYGNVYKLKYNPENLISFMTKTDNTGAVAPDMQDGTTIPELQKLCVRPTDNNLNKPDKWPTVLFDVSGTNGVEIGGNPGVITVPSVLSGNTAFIRIKPNTNVSITAKKGNTDLTLTKVSKDDGTEVYSYKNTGESAVDIDFTIKNLNILQAAVSVDDKPVSAAGYATEARRYPVDFTMAETLLDDEQKAYIVTGTEGEYVKVKEVQYIPAGDGVMITGKEGEASTWPLFTTDVDRVTSEMTGNKLIGVVEQPTENVGQIVDGKYNYMLSTGGYQVVYGENQDPDDPNVIGTINKSLSGLGFYLVLKTGTSVNGTPYPGGKPKANSSYLQLDSKLAHGSMLEDMVDETVTSNGAPRSVFYIKFVNDMNNPEEPLAEDFGDQDVTSISLQNAADVDAVWYNMNGQKLNGKPAKGGIYIMNGKKVVVK